MPCYILTEINPKNQQPIHLLSMPDSLIDDPSTAADQAGLQFEGPAALPHNHADASQLLWQADEEGKWRCAT